MKKAISISMLAGVVIATGLASAAAGNVWAGGHMFNQPMTSQQFNGGFHHGGHFNHGRNFNRSRIIADPKNPASVRDWSKPQAKSVFCLGAGCTLHYPTPQQQTRFDGRQVCNNSGCHPR